MQADREAAVVPRPRGAEPLDLRALCARQRDELMTLRETVALFRRGVHRLGVENDHLRAFIDVMGALEHARHRPDERQRTETELELGAHTSAAARAVVTASLRARAPYRVLDRARLIASELTTDGDPRSDEWLVLRIESSRHVIRLEVEPPKGRCPRRLGQQLLHT